MEDGSRSVSSVVSIVLLVAVVVVLGATISIFTLQIGEDLSDPGPRADFQIEINYIGDGVQKNDSIAITHMGGGVVERERLEVVVGDDVVYNETENSETTGNSYQVPGLVVEVNPGDEFNDLNKPCYIDGNLVSPIETCGGPPGHYNGSDSGVVMQWAENVSAGETIVIQERNNAKAVDVIEPGETVKLIYQGDEYTELMAKETIPEDEGK